MFNKTLSLGLAGIALAVLSGCNLEQSEDVVRGQVGKTLDQVIADWGFPTNERMVAGRRLVIWEDVDLSYDNVPQVGLNLPIGDNGSVSATIPLSDPEELACRRVLQINSAEKVVAGTLEGNNCPYYAPQGW